MSEMQKNVNSTASSNFTMSTSSASSNNHNNNSEQPQKKRQKIEKNKSFRNDDRSVIINEAQSPPDLDNTADDDDESDKKHLCSSISSLVSSISTNCHSSNSSPISTPDSSRAASLSQLLNVQNMTNTLPVGCTDSSVASNVSSGEHSTDEVDRVPTNSMSPSILTTSSIFKTQQKQQPTNNFGNAESSVIDMQEFEESLKQECLCGVAEHTLRKPFQSHYSQDANGAKRIANLCEWPTNKLLQFLSNLQLLFDIYLKQNSKGFICARIMDVCDALIRNDHNLIDEIIVLAGYSNAFVQFLAGRVLASFLVIAKQDMNDDWLKKLVDYLFNFEHLNHVAVQKIHFSLEIIKRIVEWKDVGTHPLEDEIESETEIRAKTDESPTVTEMQAATSEPTVDTRTYLHFPMQQPTLETNYFAVHFHKRDTDQGGDGSVDVGSNENHTSNTIPHVNSNNHMPQISSNVHFFNSTIESRQPPSSSFHISNAHSMQNFFNEADLHNFQQAHYQNVQQLSLNGSEYRLSDGCHIITLTDSESYDTTHLKCITIKILENKWPALVKNMSALIANHLNIENAENCILNFLQLWENIISVKANLSIVETLPFYAQLNKFELLLNQNLSCTIYKQMLCLFNEALCYGSTLALQDLLPDETCLLAHQVVRHVKDFSILESLPRRQPENIVSLIGFKRKPVIYAEIGTLDYFVQQAPSQLIGGDAIEMDKTILQKMVLLVLKSIAVTVKEIRSDSSDSSIDSTDYDAFQDIVLIERSICDVLQKLESFIKNTLEFHPECHFSKILIHLFDDQDDHLIEAMVCTLDVTSGISFRNNAFPDLVSMLNPVYTFLEFLKMISNSSDLLLDLLVSNETCFLLYLLRFLKYIRVNWTMLEQSCLDFGMGSNTLDKAMSVLIRLRLQISRLVSRQLYPYDISPVLRLLESCESLYEGNELS